MTSLFDVKGQTLTPLETFDVVSETVNYLTFAFMFSYDWDGLTKSAIFTKGDDKHEVVLVNDAITADKHVNLSAGEWTLSVVGSTVVDAVVTKQITTTPYTFTVTQADAVEGEMFPPSVASQVYVNVNQTTPQTFVGGVPKLAADRVIDHDNEIADKKYVDDQDGSGAVAAHNGDVSAHLKKFADYVTFEYLATWELDNRADWNENDATNHGYILNKPTIPTTTSELANDSGYATQSYVDSAVSAAISDAIGGSY